MTAIRTPLLLTLGLLLGGAAQAGSLRSGAFTEPVAGPTGHTLTEVMGEAPAVDDTGGALPADVQIGKTFWGLQSGAWGFQTGGRAAAAVPKTGQTTSSGTGDDGALQVGVAWPSPRFTDNTDGTVTENLTGLIWLKDANCFGTRDWAKSLSKSAALTTGQCGLSDGSAAGAWRLPNVREMHSLIDFGNNTPALPAGHPFSGVKNNNYWSSTHVTTAGSSAWYMLLTSGDVYYANASNHIYFWPVRGGQ